MGQTLSEPVTAKETASCGNNYVKVGSSCMQGWRTNMEDAHTHLLAVPDDKESCFFAVYDGHGGAKVAQYAGNHLHKKITQSEAYTQGRIEDAIREGFLRLDEDMIQDEEMRGELAGTTAVIVLLKGNKIYCGNVGDSRAVASCSGIADPLSFDHKPSNEEEAKRIMAAGGWVEFNRVNGNLALSRALGDFVFKRNDDKSAEEQIVTALPDVTVADITDDHEFILLACDGIWDVMTNQEVVDFCRDRLAAGMEPETVCEELLTRCLAPDCHMGGLGCDNMTAVLVCLLQNQPYEVFRQKCTRPRRPTTPLFDEDDDELHGSFVTPPRTPIVKVSTPALILNVKELMADGLASHSPPPSSTDVVEEQMMDASCGGGDQTVPEVVRESSSDTEPATSPASKQGKISFGDADEPAATEKSSSEPMKIIDQKHVEDDEDAPPNVFSSERIEDELHHSTAVSPATELHRGTTEPAEELRHGTTENTPKELRHGTTENTPKELRHGAAEELRHGAAEELRHGTAEELRHGTAENPSLDLHHGTSEKASLELQHGPAEGPSSTPSKGPSTDPVHPSKDTNLENTDTKAGNGSGNAAGWAAIDTTSTVKSVLEPYQKPDNDEQR